MLRSTGSEIYWTDGRMLIKHAESLPEGLYDRAMLDRLAVGAERGSMAPSTLVAAANYPDRERLEAILGEPRKDVLCTLSVRLLHELASRLKALGVHSVTISREDSLKPLYFEGLRESLETGKAELVPAGTSAVLMPIAMPEEKK